MVYLLLGSDLKAKDSAIAKIKANVFKTPNAHLFDLENLDAHHIGEDVLKKALITLPVVNPKRLVIVNNIHKLKAQDTASLLTFVKSPQTTIELVLESSETTFKGDLKNIMPFCSTQVLEPGPKANVFDMTKLMTAGKPKEALLTLSTLFQDGVHPLQILGGLAWFWGKDGRRLAPIGFEEGLKALEEADVNIKRSRLDANFAVEKVVVTLGLLLSRR